MLQISSAAVILFISLSSFAFAQSVSTTGKSPGEIAAASRQLAEKEEGCRIEAKQQHLHLLKRRTFMRDCMKQ